MYRRWVLGTRTSPQVWGGAEGVSVQIFFENVGANLCTSRPRHDALPKSAAWSELIRWEAVNTRTESSFQALCQSPDELSSDDERTFYDRQQMET